MSRGFVKEDDQEEPPFIPPRAPLPAGAVNHVTPRGMELLLKEREEWEQERARVIASAMDDRARRRDLAVLNGRLDLLNERLASARVVEPIADPTEVRFGTTVTFTFLSGPQRGRTNTFTIVGVDEADVKQGRIAFTAPIAVALAGRSPGEEVEFRLGAEVRRLKIIRIN
jgi:transcription elongation factor GreB